MPLDPQAQAIIDLVNSSGFGEISDITPGEMREQMKAMTALETPAAVHRVENITIPGPAGDIPARLYAPEVVGPLPVLVWYHGGGWVIGDLETHDGICRDLANAIGCVVISVDYRLAPEHPFPAAVDDAFAALAWISAHAEDLGGDPARLAVGGDSAGGQLAAVSAIAARDANIGLVFQLLVYPAVEREFERPSMIENSEGYLLTREAMQWFYGHYLNDPADAEDWRVTPARAKSLAGLPPAFVVTAEFDPLRDQGIAYSDALAAAGNTVTATTYEGMFHGFFSMGLMLDRAKVAVEDATEVMRDAFAV